MWRIKYLKYSTEMKIALAQLNYTIGDIDGNANLIIEAVRRAEAEGADLVLFE